MKFFMVLGPSDYFNKGEIQPGGIPSHQAIQEGVDGLHPLNFPKPCSCN